MKTIRELTGTNRSVGMFGVEVEVEATNGLADVNISDTNWLYTYDDSLRGEYTGEYIFKTPQNLMAAKNSVKSLFEIFNNKDVGVLDSGRAGTHIHVNMKDLTPKQVCSFALHWYLIEDLLIKWNGPSRQNNMFAVPISIAPQALDYIPRLYQEKNGKNISYGLRDYFNADYHKYSSLNWCRLYDLNTLETRIWNPKDWDKVIKGLDVLDNIYKVSKEVDSVLDMSERYSMSGPLDFAKNILGVHLEEIMKNTNTTEEALKKNLRDSFWNIQMCLKKCKPVEKPKVKAFKKNYVSEEIDLESFMNENIAIQRQF